MGHEGQRRKGCTLSSRLLRCFMQISQAVWGGSRREEEDGVGGCRGTWKGWEGGEISSLGVSGHWKSRRRGGGDWKQTNKQTNRRVKSGLGNAKGQTHPLETAWRCHLRGSPRCGRVSLSVCPSLTHSLLLSLPLSLCFSLASQPHAAAAAGTACNTGTQ